MIYGGPRHRELLLRARAMIAVLSVLLGVAVFSVARRWAGAPAGLAALVLYAFDPLAIAHAGLATTDLGGACFYFLAAVALPGAILWGGARRIAACGALVGIALASKFSNVTLLGVDAAIAALAYRLASKGRYLVRAVAVVAVAVVAVGLTYGPAGPGLYLAGMKMLRFHGEVGHPAYAFGQYSSRGWWWYFPAAWLVKTPIPILVASFVGVIVASRRFAREPFRVLSVLLPAGLILAAAMAFSLNIGVRHLLPMTPFLAVAGGLAAERAWAARTAWGKAVVLGGAVWLAAGTLRVHPEEIAYANEASGGPSRLWLKLADSNVDWGQALPALAAEIGRHPLRRLYLAYFGTADPRAYGIRYHWISSMTMIERRYEDGPAPDGREWIASSVTNLLDVYTEPHDLFAWLRRRPRTAFPGYSIALFDITGDAEAHRRIGECALRVGDPVTAERPLRRAIELCPEDGQARASLARALAALGKLEEARQQCAEALRLLPSEEARELCRLIEKAR
jgi:4-amino-4-deoxy-L-arabinose transferase-like glycosyltransferase